MGLLKPKRIRSGAVRAIDQLGLRDTALAVRGRWSPSYTSRRDHQDMTLLRAIVATVLGGGARGVDVGANRGAVSQMFFDVAPQSRHLLIEPVGELARELATRFPEATVVDAVCTDEPGEVGFNVAIDQPTRSSVHLELARTGGRTEARTVRAVRLDDLVGDEAVSMVKIDVEGGELEVLRGATHTLAAHRPVVVFEHAHRNGVPASHSRSIFELLERHAFRVFDIGGATIADADAFWDVVTAGRIWTFLAVPVGPATMP